MRAGIVCLAGKYSANQPFSVGVIHFGCLLSSFPASKPPGGASGYASSSKRHFSVRLSPSKEDFTW